MTDPASATTLVDEKERVSLGKADDGVLVSAPLEPRYRDVAPLGEGGMGEVRLARDLVVGRDVAVKRVRAPMDRDAIARERFLREARVQGQLEHPSIVPVYDLATTPDGRIYFTMRRVRGRALDETKLSRHALLSAMSRVCLAVDFAHARGVVHRDIKPNNLMIGDYGEVYVLDWGLAKLTGSEDPLALAFSEESAVVGSGKTTVGSILGTPGYLSPEQARGEEVDERADVYALGVCLFEVLANKPLFEIGPAQAMIVATLAGANARLSERAPEVDVPIELEAICVRATQTNRDDRFASAREMSEAIERFLEGDRDLERRRARARDHARAAVALTEAAFGEASDESARRDAMREVGRALANNPDNADARRVLVRLLTEPPRVVPSEVVAQAEAERETTVRSARRLGALAFVAALTPNAIILWMGVRSMPWFLAGTILGVLGAILAAVPATRFFRARRTATALVAIGALVVDAQVASPLVAISMMALALGAGLALFPQKTRTEAAVAAMLVGIILPFALEWIGVLTPTFHIIGDTIVIDGRVAHFREVPFLAWFFVATILPGVATCVYLAHVRDRLSEAEQRIRLQAWQLRQILPPA